MIHNRHLLLSFLVLGGLSASIACLIEPLLGQNSELAKSDRPGFSLTYMDDILPSVWSVPNKLPSQPWSEIPTYNRRISNRIWPSWAFQYSVMTRWLAGYKDVRVALLAGEGKHKELVQALQKEGGAIEFQLPAIGYIRALVPLSAVQDLLRNSAVEEIESAHVLNVTYLENPRIRPIIDAGYYKALDRERDVIRIAYPDNELSSPLAHHATQTLFNPKMVYKAVPDRRDDLYRRWLPHADLGVEALWRSHRELDGRGVTVGVVDNLPQLNHPAFQYSLALDGTKRQKFPRIAADPGTFLDEKSTFVFHAPTEEERAEFRLLFSSMHGSPDAFYVAKGRIAPEYADSIPAIFDRRTKTFGFDLNRNGEIGPTELFHDYNTDPGSSVLYTTKFPSLIEQSGCFFLFAERESGRPPKARFVAETFHGTMDSGSVAANEYPAMPYAGVAPGAAVVPHPVAITAEGFRYSAASITETLLQAILAPDVDIVTGSFADGWTGETSLGLQQKAIERALQVNPKPVFLSRSNSSGSLDGSPGNTSLVYARGVVSIGAAVGPGISNVVFGDKNETGSWPDPITSAGPSSDGARANVLFTDSRYIAASSCIPEDIHLRKAPNAGVAAKLLPHCIWPTWGTSGAAPLAAGAAADLLSGLKQRGYRGDKRVVTEALMRTASPVPNNGLDNVAGTLRVDNAWEWIEKNVLSRRSVESRSPRPLLAREAERKTFAVVAPVRDEESLRSGRYYSERGLVDRYFSNADVHRCTQIWIRRSARQDRASLHIALKLRSSSDALTLETADLESAESWKPVQLCAAHEIDGLYTGTLELRAHGTDDILEEVPLTIASPQKLGIGKNDLTVNAEQYGGMLREVYASVPLVALPASGDAQPYYAETLLRGDPISNIDYLYGNALMNRVPSSTTGDAPPRGPSFRSETGLLISSLSAILPVYPGREFGLRKVVDTLKESFTHYMWEVTSTAKSLEQFKRISVSLPAACGYDGTPPPAIYLNTVGAQDGISSVTECMSPMQTPLVRLSLTKPAKQIVILKASPSTPQEIAAFHFKDGVWVQSYSSFQSIWKNYESIDNPEAGEWVFFVRNYPRQ